MNALEIAPLLRGHTFNGTTSSIVHQIEHLDHPELICTLDQIASQLTPTTRSVHIKKSVSFSLELIMTMPLKDFSRTPCFGS